MTFLESKYKSESKEYYFWYNFTGKQNINLNQMETTTGNQLTTFTRVSIIVNTLIFGVTGVIYLINKSNYIGILLLAAGFTNVVSLLLVFSKKNMFYMVLNFLYAAVSIVVCIDYLFKETKYIALIWLVIALYYLITGFILLMKINKAKKETPTES